MATYEEQIDKLVTCPYDPAHKVKESRYQLHISKCEKNNLNLHKDTCPFNARHKTPAGELAHHIMTCTCRVAVDRQLNATATNDSYGGHLGVPSYHSEQSHPGIDENWDNEIQYTAPGYVRSIEPPSGGIRTEFAGWKPSDRKKYYESLHHKNDAVSEEKSMKTATSQELREPKTLSYAQMLNQRKPVHELQNIGLGRGQPVPSPKIAANIFGQHPAPMRQPKLHTPGFESPTLGMGRGDHAVNGDDSEQETDFFALGRGRGKRN